MAFRTCSNSLLCVNSNSVLIIWPLFNVSSAACITYLKVKLLSIAIVFFVIVDYSGL